jgi:addiction module RelE/StbE family toxin
MMSVYKLEYSVAARSDLGDIFDYIAGELQMRKAAVSITGLIRKKIDGLVDFPRRCVAIDIDELADKGYRKLVVKNYVVVYKVEEKKRRVVVMRVFYGGRDYYRDLL